MSRRRWSTGCWLARRAAERDARGLRAVPRHPRLHRHDPHALGRRDGGAAERLLCRDDRDRRPQPRLHQQVPGRRLPGPVRRAAAPIPRRRPTRWPPARAMLDAVDRLEPHPSRRGRSRSASASISARRSPARRLAAAQGIHRDRRHGEPRRAARAAHQGDRRAAAAVRSGAHAAAARAAPIDLGPLPIRGYDEPVRVWRLA